jgi:hypothetical protein
MVVLIGEIVDRRLDAARTTSSAAGLSASGKHRVQVLPL